MTRDEEINELAERIQQAIDPIVSSTTKYGVFLDAMRNVATNLCLKLTEPPRCPDASCRYLLWQDGACCGCNASEAQRKAKCGL